MSEYTELFADKIEKLDPEDDCFEEHLVEIARSFRSFDDSLGEFIRQRGYTGAEDDKDAKIAFVLSRFAAASIKIDRRVVKRWFYEHTRGADRKTAFKLCFAFGLGLEEAQELFRKVYLMRGIDCHDASEAVFYFCLKNGLSYAEAEGLISRLPKIKAGGIDYSGELLYTGSIIKEIDRFCDADELLSYLISNIEQFGYNNATAYSYINRLWTLISDAQGLANREWRLLFDSGPSKKERSVWDIYEQIFGLADFDEADNSRIFAMKSDRTLKPILKDNELINPIAADSFPDRQGLEGIIRGEHQSSETVRKTLILLAFYRFWSRLSVEHRSVMEYAGYGDSQRCLCEINNFLVQAGYPELYEGNPYDWLFMFASQDEEPLWTFRYIICEMYSQKQESLH